MFYVCVRYLYMLGTSKITVGVALLTYALYSVLNRSILNLFVTYLLKQYSFTLQEYFCHMNIDIETDYEIHTCILTKICWSICGIIKM